MAKAAKKIKYMHGELPQELGAILAKADENDLKILISLLMAADAEGVVPESFSVSTALGLEKTDVAAAIKFWRGTGFIESATAKAAQSLPVAQASADKVAEDKTPKAEAEKSSAAKAGGAKIETAHRDGVIESADDAQNYRSAELADILEQRAVTSEFIDEAQRVFGKTFNSYDTGIVIGLVDRLGFDEESVLAILSYAVRSGKRGLRQAEKVAIGFYDDGYTTSAEVHAHIADIERSKETVFQIKKLYGATDRALSTSEKNMFERWSLTFGYDIDVIKIAYDITIDIKHEPIPRYTNAILENWHKLGLRTPEEIRAHEERERESRQSAKQESAASVAKKDGKAANGGDSDKSYILDDFFEVALKRTFEDHE